MQAGRIEARVVPTRYEPDQPDLPAWQPEHGLATLVLMIDTRRADIMPLVTPRVSFGWRELPSVMIPEAG